MAATWTHTPSTRWSILVTTPSTFRVVTLNILHDPPQLTWSKRALLVEAGLIALQPDIVLLQEVAWPDEQASGLADALQTNTGKEYRTHVTGLFATTGWQEGLAILTRYPFDVAELVFPRAETFCHRVRLDIDGNVVDVYNSHLDPYSADRRTRQITMATAWMKRFHDANGSIFGGDLNATPASTELAPLSATLRSAYAAAHGDDPAHIIDYLWISSSLTVAAAELALDRPAAHDPLLLPSDHHALCADIGWASPKCHR